MSKRADILEEAKRVITERQAVNGVAEDSFDRIADIWTVLGGDESFGPLSPDAQVALHMAGLKLARLVEQSRQVNGKLPRDVGKLSPDHLVDAIGYLAICYELLAEKGHMTEIAPVLRASGTGGGIGGGEAFDVMARPICSCTTPGCEHVLAVRERLRASGGTGASA